MSYNADRVHKLTEIYIRETLDFSKGTVEEFFEKYESVYEEISRIAKLKDQTSKAKFVNAAL